MADDIKSYPPTERRLATLSALGFVPTSRALVGAAVIRAAWLALLAAGPGLVHWAARAVEGSIDLASTADGPDAARQALTWLALPGAAIAGLAGVICLAAAVTATQVQLAGWGGSTGAPAGGSLPAGARAAAGAAPGGLELGWLMLMAAVAIVSVALAARSALSYAEQLAFSGPDELLQTSAAAALAIGWQVLAALVALGVLDYLMQRAAFWRLACMSRREMAEELRQTEGHPLTVQRRRMHRRRRQRHA